MEGLRLLSLLEHASKMRETLTAPHTAKFGTRFDSAVKARNEHVRSEGQPERHHKCDRCCRQFKERDAYFVAFYISVYV
jgi:ribosomal protein L37AE/L43A